jgi:hypothetical protein
MLPVLPDNDGELAELDREIDALFDMECPIARPEPVYKGILRSDDPVYRRDYWHNYYQWRKLNEPDWQRNRKGRETARAQEKRSDQSGNQDYRS